VLAAALAAASALRAAVAAAFVVASAAVSAALAVFEQLLQRGVVVRPLAGFGAPSAIRVSVGTSEENAFFAAALGHVLSGVSS